MSCNKVGMARKNHPFKQTHPATQIASMNLRSAVSQLSPLPALLRRKPGTVRRRIPIVMYGASPQPVKIRHTFQNLGSPADDNRLTHSPQP